MQPRVKRDLIGFLLFTFLTVCGTKETIIETNLEDPLVEEEVVEEAGKVDTLIYIVDRTGKKWEIGHAVVRYGFQPEKFQFGLGPHAIPPIINPEMIGPGDHGYPDEHAGFLVLGTRLEEEARAYPLGVMSAHEVVDEDFDEIVAVAY